ncbi:MAG: hypothetical protein PHF13_06550 [Acholeplasmataceae bacterium]|nr:hypothetical protein [Acholeplasmataceae bacterium]
MIEHTKNTKASVICMALIYFLPLCISSAYISWNIFLPNAVTEGLFASLMFLLPIAALIGVLTYRKTLGRENTTWVTVLFIALALLPVINIGMCITNIIGGTITSPAMLTNFLRTLIWITFVYFSLILAPLFSLVVPKLCEGQKPQKILSGVSKGFAVFSIFYLLYSTFSGISGDAYDVVVPGMPPAYPWYISPMFMLSLAIIWALFGFAVGACMIWLCRKSENEVCMRNESDEI